MARARVLEMLDAPNASCLFCGAALNEARSCAASTVGTLAGGPDGWSFPRVFRYLLDGRCAKAGQWSQALRLLSRMEASAAGGDRPPVSTFVYNIAMAAVRTGL